MSHHEEPDTNVSALGDNFSSSRYYTLVLPFFKNGCSHSYLAPPPNIIKNCVQVLIKVEKSFICHVSEPAEQKQHTDNECREQAMQVFI